MSSTSSYENALKSSNEKTTVSSNVIAENRVFSSPEAAPQHEGKAASEVLHRKRFSSLAIVGLAFAILNSPTAASASLSVVIVSGGPVAAIWGMLISATGVLCIAASMAEITSILPTPGGPYHFAYRLAPPSFQVGLAYFTGWLAAAGWICLTATASSLAGSLISGIIALLHPNYEGQSWHAFLIYIAFAIGAWCINVFGVRALDGINKAAIIWSLAGVALIIITTLSCASPQYQSGQFVFATYINRTGWSDGVAFILGLLQSTFAMLKWNDTNYVMYISSDGPTGNRIYALHNDGKDLTSGWTFAGVVQYSDGRVLVGYDAFAFHHPNGNKYLFYTNTTTIFINKLLPDFGFATVQPKEGRNGTIVVSRAELEYTEAPAVLISGKKLNFLYSQNSFFSPNYTTYNIPVSTNADPLNPETWSKPKPVRVLTSSQRKGVYGTGSVGAFTGPDDKPWLAYTCFYEPKPFDRYTSDPRYVQVQPIELINDEIQPLIPVKPGHKVQKVHNNAYIPRYTDLDLRFFKKPAVRDQDE